MPGTKHWVTIETGRRLDEIERGLERVNQFKIESPKQRPKSDKLITFCLSPMHLTRTDVEPHNEISREVKTTRTTVQLSYVEQFHSML